MSDRIDGWKTIAAHFGRDRSTVVRWARDRGLPVHAIPGGKTRTVYALKSELDAWAMRQADIETQNDVVTSPSGVPRLRAPGLGRMAPLALPALALPVAIGLWFGIAPGRHEALPRERTAAQLFLKARDERAERNPVSLARSVAALQKVNAIAPDFAPGFSELADAYLLEQEDGSLPAGTAFNRASEAATRAQHLDATLAGPYRALGFVAYWRDGDGPHAGALFRRALALNDADAETHFWFANVLADSGQDVAAMSEFDRARFLDAGSDNIAADLAWANWMAGRDDLARAQLAAVIAEHPSNAEAHSCLSVVLLSGGDLQGYLAETATLARLQADTDFAAQGRSLAAALAAHGSPGFWEALVRTELRNQRARPVPNHAKAAFFASLAGDRARVVDILTVADQEDEKWGAAGFVRRIAARWRSDPAITALLARRRASAIT